MSASKIPRTTSKLSPNITTITRGISKLDTSNQPKINGIINNVTVKQPAKKNFLTAHTSTNINEEKRSTINSKSSRPTTASPKRSSTNAPRSFLANGVTKNTTSAASTAGPAISKRNTVMAKRGVSTLSTPPDMETCKICARHFVKDRILVHQEVCEIASKRKRKVFDPVKQRLKGTEAEPLINRIKIEIKKQPPPKPSNWRKKHEEFLANIRAARLMKQHLAKGGKISDLPPPPPLDTSDYTPCPHCGRKFNEAAAERHIPKCVNIRHNKPKAAANSSRAVGVTSRTKTTTLTRKR